VRVTLEVDALGPELGGIGRYTWELCRQLPAHPEIDQLSFYGRGRFLNDPALLLSDSPLAKRSYFERFVGRRLKPRRWKTNLVHGPNYFLPKQAETGIITVHDLSVRKFPETHPIERVRQFEDRLEESLGRACHIITDTETVRQELISEMTVPEQKVTAVPLGVDPRFRPRSMEQLTPVLDGFGLRAGGYALCVSTIEPRKKIAELLDVWRSLPAALRDSVPLVLIGGQGWRSEEIHRQIEAASGQGWLRHLGYVPEEQLPALWSGALLSVYPSIYEGFGLPAAEAMASGVPLIVADRSCLPEVCGDAAAYVDPDDIDEFRKVVHEALQDQEWRRSARQRGLARASQYNWAACVDATVAVYQRVWREELASR
jgi:alpha-1,3-rhamnosyl/mannosyltransferase